MGALLYGAAAAAAATGALAFDGPIDLGHVRETAPLAAVVGAVLGYGVNERWPMRWETAAGTGFLTAFVGVVFFSGLYLFGDAVIQAYLGQSSVDAVGDAAQRLKQRLPIAAPLAVGALTIAGVVMWILGALGRRLFRRASSSGGDRGDPGAAGAA